MDREPMRRRSNNPSTEVIQKASGYNNALVSVSTTRSNAGVLFISVNMSNNLFNVCSINMHCFQYLHVT